MSDFTGTVRTVTVNKGWGGIFIQLDGAPIFEPGSACPNSFAFVPIGDDFAKHFLAVATAAKTSGEPIRISTSGCTAGNYAGAEDRLDRLRLAPVDFVQGQRR